MGTLVHGHYVGNYPSPEYMSWMSMIQRCTNPKHEAYRLYGGRGIRVCHRWRQFKNFFVDMGRRPSKRYTLERKNSNRGYSLSNCRWATWEEQSRNRAANHRLTFRGRTRCLTDWAKEIGLSKTTLRMRLVSGWSVAQALTTKKGVYRKKEKR